MRRRFRPERVLLSIFLGPARIAASEVRIHPVDIGETPVIAHMIVMRVRIYDAYRKFGQGRHDCLNVADAMPVSNSKARFSPTIRYEITSSSWCGS